MAAAGVNYETVEHVWDNYLDIASFAGVGYLSGRTVNWFTNWTSASSILTKAEQVDLTSAVGCCALFAAIDRLAYSMLSYYASHEVNKPIYSILRVGASAIAAVSLFNGLIPQSIETKSGVAVILTAVLIYSQILMQLTVFNSRYGRYALDEDYLYI